MTAHWTGIARDLRAGLREMRSGMPDVMKAFSGIAQAALQAKALDTKTKEPLGHPPKTGPHNLTVPSRGDTVSRICAGSCAVQKKAFYIMQPMPVRRPSAFFF